MHLTDEPLKISHHQLRVDGSERIRDGRQSGAGWRAEQDYRNFRVIRHRRGSLRSFIHGFQPARLRQHGGEDSIAIVQEAAVSLSAVSVISARPMLMFP